MAPVADVTGQVCLETVVKSIKHQSLFWKYSCGDRFWILHGQHGMRMSKYVHQRGDLGIQPTAEKSRLIPIENRFRL